MFGFFNKKEIDNSKVKLSRRSFLKGVGVSAVLSVLPSVAKSGIIIHDTFDQDKFSIWDMFKKLQRYAGMNLSKNYRGKNPNYVGEEFKTIIIIEDAHFGNKLTTSFDKFNISRMGITLEDDERWTKEKDQIEILKSRFGVRLFGLEGYNNINDFYNAEVELVKFMIGENSSFLIGLEEINLQKMAMDVIVLERFVSYSTTKFFSVKDVEMIKFMCGIWKDDLGSFERNKSYLLKLVSEKYGAVEEVYVDSFAKISFSIFGIMESSYSLGISYNIFIKFYSSLCKKYPHLCNLSYDEFRVKSKVYVEDNRDVYAAEKLLLEMDKREVKVAAIIFGIAHTKGIISQLKKLTNQKINIYVAK